MNHHGGLEFRARGINRNLEHRRIHRVPRLS